MVHYLGTKWKSQNERPLRKFKDQVFRLLYHTFVTIWGYVLMRNECWWLYGDDIEVRNIPSWQLPIK